LRPQCGLGPRKEVQKAAVREDLDTAIVGQFHEINGMGGQTLCCAERDQTDCSHQPAGRPVHLKRSAIPTLAKLIAFQLAPS
jgi:hypothetical protein